jgi:dihydrolipoamide dehydrogenase
MGLNSKMNPLTFTRVLFTQPQVASVGMTEKEAKKAGHDVIVGAAPYGMNPLGMLLSENEGIVEVVADKNIWGSPGCSLCGKQRGRNGRPGHFVHSNGRHAG